MSRRDTGEFLRQIREFLLGRKPVGHTRFQPDLSKRTQPPPEIPLGPASCKLANNYYYNRDPRREVKRPTIIIDSSKKLTKSKKEDECEEDSTNKKTKLPTPGKFYKY